MSRQIADDSPMIASAGAGCDMSPRALAQRPEIGIGHARIVPGRRLIATPGGEERLEPRVMQVLLALVDANGAVLSRDDLIRLCWAGQIVGEDAIQRPIAELRRVAARLEAGFAIETIPRVGYRIECGRAEPRAQEQFGGSRTANPPPGWSRRAALAAAVLGVGAPLVYLARGDRGEDARIAPLLSDARRALREELPDADAQGVAALEQVVAIEPDHAVAWGLLALARRNMFENSGPETATRALNATEDAVARALAIDPREPNALVARATLAPPFGDWLKAEDDLRAILAFAPANIAALSAMTTLMQSVARLRDSHLLNERAATLDPLSPVYQFRRAYKHWIFGKVDEADLWIERALGLWPRHPAVWNTRLSLFAYTGRADAGLTLLEDRRMRPATMGPPAIALWRQSLIALAGRRPADVAAARAANVEAARRSPGFALNAIMTLASLDEVDAAFAVADGYLLRQGPVVGSLWTGGGQMPVNDQRWRRTMFLFTPAALPLHRDPRFAVLCDGIGLTDYWRRRGIDPEPVGEPMRPA